MIDIAKASFLAMTLAVYLIAVPSGCTTTGKVENTNATTNQAPLKAFNDEKYVWESWEVGTNKVEVLNLKSQAR